jgi:hypothetical protein
MKKFNKSSSTPKNSLPSKFKKFNWKLLLILAVNTVVILGFYLLATNFSFFMYVLAAYMILTAGFSIAFVVYNRGFSRRGVTLDMLPDTMTPEEKTEFIADGERRLKKSKWMLTVILPFLFTFAYELINLYFSEFFTSLFS